MDTDANTHAASAGPVGAHQRIVSLDRLRGVAILGILVMNIYAFAMPFIGYTNPLRMGGTEPWNLGTWVFTHLLFDQKFISIFAMLFGAGLVLMTGRAEARGGKPGRIYVRRQLWLMLIGTAHAYLLWMGDILFLYALIGLFAYLFRKRQPRTLIIIACLLLPVTLLLNAGNAIQMETMISEVATAEALVERGEALDDKQQQLLEDWETQRAFMMPNDADVQADLDAHLGGYAEIVAYRAPTVAMMQLFLPIVYGIWRVGALMLIGMAMMKLGILTAERSAGFYTRFMLTGYLFGLPLTAFSAWDLFAHHFEPIYTLRIGGIANYAGSLLVAFGHIGLIMLVTRTGVLRRTMDRFAAVGRMALTNYLMHSLVLTTVFYGYGLGLYGSVPRAWQMAFVVGVVGFQLWFSTWWLARFRFGPAEWLWRSATYWKMQPIR
jgi:uncharacterized protein